MKSKTIAKHWRVNFFDNNDIDVCYLGNACTKHKKFDNITEAKKFYDSITSQKKIYGLFPDAVQQEREFRSFLGMKKK